MQPQESESPPTDRTGRVVQQPEPSRFPTPASEAEDMVRSSLVTKESRAELLVAIRKYEQGKTDGLDTNLNGLVSVLALLEPMKLQQLKELLVKEPSGRGNEQADQILVKQLLALFPKENELEPGFKTYEEGFASVREEMAKVKQVAQRYDESRANLLNTVDSVTNLSKDKVKELDEDQEILAKHPKQDNLGRRRHFVLKGDTLKSIAETKLRDRQLSELIYNINRSVITTPVNKPLTPKLVLYLPTADEVAEYRKRLDESAN